MKKLRGEASYVNLKSFEKEVVDLIRKVESDFTIQIHIVIVKADNSIVAVDSLHDGEEKADDRIKKLREENDDYKYVVFKRDLTLGF